MADKKTNALITLPTRALEKIGVEPKRILSAMVSDALAVVRSQERTLAAMRFRVGNYELCDSDYRQILLWSDALGFAPDIIIGRLASSVWNLLGRKVEFVVKNGSIRSLVWDFDFLQIAAFEWVDGLKIGQLAFKGSPTAPIALRLPSLHKLICANLGLTELDLSPVPKLTYLSCDNNQLTELDLSPVPKLTELWCDRNQLTELDLSMVPGLTDLSCNDNQLTELDLSPVLGLTYLSCNDNQLTELDLFPVPGLYELGCGSNRLAKLDLSPVLGLTALWCNQNQLTELDLSPVLGLTDLWCKQNQLTELDIRSVLALDQLQCNANVNVLMLPTQSLKNEKH